MASVTSINLMALATSLPYAAQVDSIANTSTSSVKFLSFHESFTKDILGPHVSSELISNKPYQAFHEAGVYYPATNSVYISSNWIGPNNPVNVTILNLTDYSITEERYPGLYVPNGASPYTSPHGKKYVLWCDEGTFQGASGLTLLDPVAKKTTPFVSSFLGRNFSSINDVEWVPSTGDVWFTDADYGYFQDFRPAPTIPKQVYRYSPSTGVLQAVADGFVESNGIEFSPDYKTLYVTDTGSRTTGPVLTNPASIYAFDVVDGKRLANRRLFAYADVGIPDGIHTDTKGNVFSSCSDGINVWNPEGVLLGKMVVAEGSNNFAFIPGGLLLFNGNKLYKVTIKAVGRAVKRDFGHT
jgi:gluconolactonase